MIRNNSLLISELSLQSISNVKAALVLCKLTSAPLYPSNLTSVRRYQISGLSKDARRWADFVGIKLGHCDIDSSGIMIKIQRAFPVASVAVSLTAYQINKPPDTTRKTNWGGKNDSKVVK